MYCKYCGAQISDNAVICPNCMNRVGETETAYGTNSQHNINNSINFSTNNEIPIAEHSTTGFAVCMILFFVILLVIIYSIIERSHPTYLNLLFIPIFILFIVLLTKDYGIYFKLYNNRLEARLISKETKKKEVYIFSLNEIQAVSVQNRLILFTAKNNHYNIVAKDKEQAQLVKSILEKNQNPISNANIF